MGFAKRSTHPTAAISVGKIALHGARFGAKTSGDFCPRGHNLGIACVGKIAADPSAFAPPVQGDFAHPTCFRRRPRWISRGLDPPTAPRRMSGRGPRSLLNLRGAAGTLQTDCRSAHGGIGQAGHFHQLCARGRAGKAGRRRNAVAHLRYAVPEACRESRHLRCLGRSPHDGRGRLGAGDRSEAPRLRHLHSAGVGPFDGVELHHRQGNRDHPRAAGAP